MRKSMYASEIWLVVVLSAVLTTAQMYAGLMTAPCPHQQMIALAVLLRGNPTYLPSESISIAQYCCVQEELAEEPGPNIGDQAVSCHHCLCTWCVDWPP